jgi:enamine deaminase RidA (YjgF/YER057c/UK114 family)
MGSGREAGAGGSGGAGGGVDPIEARLAELGLTLPAAAVPVAAYVPTRRVGSLLWVSGQIPIVNGQLTAKGVVPSGVSLEAAQGAARQCVLNGLAAAKAALGRLDRVAGVVRVGVWVACEDGFVDQPKVANGASELLVAVFGEAGKHARAAVGANSLPLGVPVEVELLLEVKPEPAQPRGSIHPYE